MKLIQINEGALLDKLRTKLAGFKGQIMGSMSQLLARFKRQPASRLTTIEAFELAELSLKLEARVDTGALSCSLHATDIVVDEPNKKVKFKHDGRDLELTLVKLKKVTNANAVAVRPNVNLTFKWNGKRYDNVLTTLADRSKLKFKLLIGRNLIRMLDLPVHINDKESE